MATETERFADLMRGFKERSGRSYGTLAKRLHSSNSTLHRYCSGAAVPTEYAPVERFARVCGASADELLALHQQWLLALVERRRAATEGPASGAGAASGAGSANSAAPQGVDAAPEAPPASAVVAGEAGATSEVRPQAETDPAPAPAPASAAAPVPGPAGAEAPVPASAPDPAPAAAAAAAAAAAPAAEAPADAPAVLVQPGPARASVPRARRHRLLLAVAAAVATAAVAGTAAAVSAMGDAGHGDTRRGAAQPSSPGRAAAGPALPSGGASSPTPAADSASPSGPGPSSPSVASASASAASPPASQGTAKEGASPTAPFTVNVLPDNWDSPCDQWFALNKAPGTVPPPPAGQATEGWARALDAVPAGHLRMQLTVQGTEGKAAVLHALYVRVVSGRKAPGWNAYTMGSGCGGALVPANFAVDLDDASPRARPLPGKEGERPTASTNFPYKVSATEPQVLNIDAATLGQDVSWYLELAWSSGDRKGTTRIDDHGRPFRTVAQNTGHSYWYNANNNAWLPYTE
ncbi:helix-turn-helix domain-containing protein [Streptomyces sp. NBC_01264]|uniref:helix-turn-helix domain-containing protein n=1 Tax=Streptomyces sp. NBC_01264 TaxID=2903804 RepID=UPI00224EBF2E|nr:helix-turn-helix transcriptional regulator [Streptomyces sp. NBC_01264]MCX4779845.1 helix-turn-helix domain-containing protein [Streptomyces sp. NBC_01264]